MKELMKKFLIQTLILFFHVQIAFSQSAKFDSLIENSISLSEQFLYDANFEEAQKFVDISFFENFKLYEEKHSIAL